MTSLRSKDDVLTLFVHLGYLAYDRKMREVFIPNEECGMGALLEKADQALYKAKESGKNGYVVC